MIFELVVFNSESQLILANSIATPVLLLEIAENKLPSSVECDYITALHLPLD